MSASAIPIKVRILSSHGGVRPRCAGWRSPRRFLEVAKIGRRLALLDGHQVAVSAHPIGLLADMDHGLALGTDVLGPDRPPGLLATVFLVHGPCPRERIVDH